MRVDVESLLASGLDAIASCGTNGELHALTLDDHARIFQLAGANTVLYMAPHTTDPNEPGPADYDRRITEDAEVTVTLYQTKWSGALPCSLLERLAAVENIRMVKDSDYLNVRCQFGDRFRWLNGMADPFVPSYWKFGVETFRSGLACFMPQVPLRIRGLAQQGHFQAINGILDTLVLPMYELRNRRSGYQVSMMKTAMFLAGLPVGGVRPPLIPIEPADWDELRKLMVRNGLLSSKIAA